MCALQRKADLEASVALEARVDELGREDDVDRAAREVALLEAVQERSSDDERAQSGRIAQELVERAGDLHPTDER